MITPAPHPKSSLTSAGILLALGLVFGSIGTSPLYVMKAVGACTDGILSMRIMLGVVSLIIWTLTLQATLKYAIFMLRADNRGEGGLLALYAMIRKSRRKLLSLAIIGASALLVTGVLTPTITIMAAAEGVKLIDHALPVVPFTLGIVVVLFLVQQFGTTALGKFFGPVMILWFLMLATLGLIYVIDLPSILKAFNPYYAYDLIRHYPKTLLLLSAIFLCVTGAEEFYAYLGFCGKSNIRVSWIFIKISLILNYLGQAAWIVLHPDDAGHASGAFFGMMPTWFLPIGIVMAAMAAIIASQSLISCSFTVVNDAIQLTLWPKVRISYPAQRKGQMYISSVNYLMLISVVASILIFGHSIHVFAAYGLAVSVLMLSTTILLAFFMQRIHQNKGAILTFTIIFGLLEIVFLVANLVQFFEGAWFALVLGGILAFIMVAWHQGRAIKNQFTRYVNVSEYEQALVDLSHDESVDRFATNLVYVTLAEKSDQIEFKIIYSIFSKMPKRAKTYWLIHINITDQPHTLEYSVKKIIPGTLNRVDFMLGYKMQPRINLYFKKVIDELSTSKEINLESDYPSLRKHHIPADFSYVIIRRIQNYDFDLPPFKQFMLDVFLWLAKKSTSDIRTYGLDTSNVIEERVPYLMEIDKKPDLMRRK